MSNLPNIHQLDLGGHSSLFYLARNTFGMLFVLSVLSRFLVFAFELAPRKAPRALKSRA